MPTDPIAAALDAAATAVAGNGLRWTPADAREDARSAIVAFLRALPDGTWFCIGDMRYSVPNRVLWGLADAVERAAAEKCE